MFCKNIKGKFATTNSNFEKIDYLDMHHRVTYYTCISISSKLWLVDQSKPCTQIYLQIIASCINLQLPIVILKKIDYLEMHHRITYMYINFQQTRVSRSVQTVHTIYLQIIASYINLQLPMVILKKLVI